MAKSNKIKSKSKKKQSRRSKAAQHGTGLFDLVSPIVSRSFSQLWQHMLNGRGRILLGMGLLLLFLGLCIPTYSYVRTSTADQNFTQTVQISIAEEVSQTAPPANLFARLGALIGDWLFNDLFGWGIFVLIGFILYSAIHVMWRYEKGWVHLLAVFLQCGFATIWISVFSAFLQLMLGNQDDLLWGGMHGKDLTNYLINQIGIWGLSIILLFTFLAGLITASDKALEMFKHPRIPKGISSDGVHRSYDRVVGISNWLREVFVSSGEEEDKEEPYLSKSEEDTTPTSDDISVDTTVSTTIEEPTIPSTTVQPAKTVESSLIIEDTREDDLVEVIRKRPEGLLPGMQLVRYEQPDIALLRDYEQGAKQQNLDEIERNKQTIIDTLASFKMPVSPYKATIGPTVTLYEVIPDQGIKVARIKTMEDDIALGLKSEGIRIIAPMPGMGTVGIEVPNSTPQTVSMRSVLASRRFNDLRESMQLPVGIGKTITNEPFVFDLAKMPHLLIAGATGQGKSVGLNAMITSLLYSKRPEELKFVLVDPKMLEFSIYAPLERHFMAKLPDAEDAIITDMTKVVPTLHSLCIEMDNRYRLLTQAKVRNILEYNEQVRSGVNIALNKGELMPYIVLIVDEFADLIMTSGKEVEQPIARLAQKARAAGIHMVIATQRPSTDVITGLIKANFPARIAFKVFSMVDSRTILDSPGANQLVGRGDMLFYQGKDMIRVQCAFLDTPETEQIVAHICMQEGPTAPYELPEYVVESDSEVKTFNSREKDPLFEEVARLVVSSQVGSTSNIQRKFNLGYNRAGRLMDQLEGSGIVSPQDGSKPREVYIKDLISLEKLLEQLH